MTPPSAEPTSYASNATLEPQAVPARESAPENLEAIAGLGRLLLDITDQIGGIALLGFHLLVRLVRLEIDWHELVRVLYKAGNRSLAIVAFTALFNGAILVIQAAPVVERFGATDFIGWAAGFGVLNELGPLLVSLMFSGRVGANNTAELGTMVVTEQVDALRALAIDPLSYLILPRVVAMTIMLAALNIVGVSVALLGSVVASQLLLEVRPGLFMQSFLDMLDQWDFLRGLIKATVFGVMIALTSSFYGLRTKGGATGVGRSVNACVVAAAVGIFGLDYLAALILK